VKSVNRDEADKRNTDAIHHWWVTMRDTGKVAPGLLDNLWTIMLEHARQHALSIEESHRGEHVPARREEQAEAGTPPLVAADLTEAVKTDQWHDSGVTADAVRAISTSPSSRTRTRTRGGPK